MMLYRVLGLGFPKIRDTFRGYHDLNSPTFEGGMRPAVLLPMLHNHPRRVPLVVVDVSA